MRQLSDLPMVYTFDFDIAPMAASISRL
jgi:hypothetical protein